MKLTHFPALMPALMILFLFLSPPLLRAQDEAAADAFDISGRTLRFPELPAKWSFRIGTGFLLTKPPADLVENAIQAPMFNARARFGLPWKLSVEADLTTIVVSNQLSLGPRVSFDFGRFSCNAGWDVAWMYGQLRQGGFDNTSSAWIHYPNVSAGYRLRDMAFTVKGEVVYMARLSQKTGENSILESNNSYNGFTVAFYLEQRLWKDNLFIIGFKDSYVEYFWPTWMVYNTFERSYHIPELSFTWIL